MVADSREALRRGAALGEELRSLAIVPGLCPRLRSSLLADLLGRGGMPAAVEVRGSGDREYPVKTHEHT